MTERKRTGRRMSAPSTSFWKRCFRQRYLILMTIPAVIAIFLFNYLPMYGVLIAFKSYKPAFGIWGSKWVGLKHFRMFFESVYAWRIIRNTLYISLYSFLFCFPAPIILALLLNEVRCSPVKRVMQTISYLPHFISTVIMVGLVKNMVALDGPINHIIKALGGDPITFLSRPEWFRTINVVSDIWQGVGWGSIIYMAALAGVPMEQYEAAIIDGANRWQQTWNITIPAILPTVVVLMILNIQGLLGGNTSKILLLYNESIYETAEIIGTYVYREGIQGMRYGYSAAVDLFTSVISIILVVFANTVSKKVTEYSLW